MTRERLTLYDTTLRDGQQTQGVQFSTEEKTEIALALDALGLDYIEGGWPGANPTDSAFFDARPETRATLPSGSTPGANRSEMTGHGSSSSCLMPRLIRLFSASTSRTITSSSWLL